MTGRYDFAAQASELGDFPKKNELATLVISSWNQIVEFLRQIATLQPATT